jgi:small subunit ribosomal protein S17
MTRGKRRRVVGIVTSDRMKKSVVVEVKRLVKHPLYGKYIRRRTKYMAHDEENAAHTGDRVELVETRPLSKRKCWRVLRILEKAPAEVVPPPEAFTVTAVPDPSKRQEVSEKTPTESVEGEAKS